MPFFQNALPGIGLVDSQEGGVDFWIFWIFSFLQLNLDWQKNLKTKLEEVFFFIFMSYYAEVSFCCSKK
jgi:hypothetical protein